MNWLIVKRETEELAIKRLNVCIGCEYKKRGICTICGCVLKAKTRVKDEYCPIDKW